MATEAEKTQGKQDGRARGAGGKKKLTRKQRRTALIYTYTAGGIALALIVILAAVLMGTHPDLAETPPAPTVAPTAAPSATPSPRPTETPAPTPEPEPTPMPVVSAAQPSEFKMKTTIYQEGEKVETYQRADEIHMGSSEEYAQVDGVLTFRGNNYRDGGAFGLVPEDASKLTIEWQRSIGGIDKWGGVGWTGQPAIVRWDESVRSQMNLKEEKKNKEGLCEVIYATLDGKIYFLDLEDGKATRSAIKLGAPIKGSVSVDPRGWPLLYTGQGIDTVNGKSVKIGYRVYSLIDQKQLLFINGKEEYAPRNWGAFDCSALLDVGSDTLLELGENGIVYSIKLNTQYDRAQGSISIDPAIDRYTFKASISGQLGMENSLCVYDHYAYFTDNSGMLQCLDLNTFEPVWLADVTDDTDASSALEEEGDKLFLYTACEVDQQKKSGGGKSHMRKFDARTGEELWDFAVSCSGTHENNGGAFGSPAIGKNQLKDLVYFHVARTKQGGTLYALNKQTGEKAWSLDMGVYGWSSPVCVYDQNGRGYVILGNSKGTLRLIDGLTGKVIDSVKLNANIEGTPAVFEDMLVVGTRGRKIYGVRIS